MTKLSMSHLVEQLPDIPGNISRNRKLMGLTQSELDAAAGIPSGTVAQYEAGNRLPSLPHFWRLLGVFGVSPEHLVGSLKRVKERTNA